MLFTVRREMENVRALSLFSIHQRYLTVALSRAKASVEKGNTRQNSKPSAMVVTTTTTTTRGKNMRSERMLTGVKKRRDGEKQKKERSERDREREREREREEKEEEDKQRQRVSLLIPRSLQLLLGPTFTIPMGRRASGRAGGRTGRLAPWDP